MLPIRLTALATMLALAPAFGGTPLPVRTDGSFRDWKKVGAALSDPVGDGAAGALDLGRLFLANDGEALYLRLEVGRETILQNPSSEPIGNSLRLYLDLDESVASGMPVEGLGAELEIRFGERSVIAYDSSGLATALAPGGVGHWTLPTHSAAAFEMRVPFDAAGSNDLARRLSDGGTLALVLSEAVIGGDRMPDSGSLAYRVSTERVKPVKGIPTGKARERHLRLLCFNVERTTIARRQALYRRLLRALRPDLIAFQEIIDWSAERTRRFVADALPLADGRVWSALQIADVVTVSSYPILAAAAVDDNLVTLIDLPDDETPHDLVLFNAHTPCCDDEEGRDREHDNLAATWRDLLAGAGPFRIGRRDAVVFAGDLNMVGFRRQLRVLKNGEFIDPANGPDFSPGRRKGSLKSALLRHTHARAVHTWRRAGSPFTPGKLDYILFSSDVARLKRSFTLDTGTMPTEILRELRLGRDDSLDASDHLALVADLLIRKK